MFGCRVGAYLSRGIGTAEKLRNWRNITRTTPKIACDFHSLRGEVRINKEDMAVMAEHEITPFLKIEPWDGLKPILNDEKKNDIEKLITDLKQFPGEVRLTLAHEMNVPKENAWYPWQGVPGDYRHAMNYFAEKIGKIGANNIKLVFNINQYDVNDIEIYYPGDRTISYLAIDGYNWGPTQTWGSRWQEFSDIFRGPIIALQEITKEKPVMIGEFSSTEVGGSKSSWIRNAFLTMKELNIESFIWFDINKEQDWRVNSSPASVAAFEESLKDPYFIQGKTLIP